ncbi:MAG TPA: bifunctional diaminohydroxyphosphoribosylaminopyrimidine deaminase/5-amino-6-(5-phosphoribosylamino)uracil reductase RibD [Acidobacteriaceae bacterium]|nr:bifunctional diaminohydroxyphosphoribosylaminopyrimidine deaminase/5-amino-6-(5-phosphoribosylamino)uracil reductase RibD [Acidobacteriaceae bacterium]
MAAGTAMLAGVVIGMEQDELWMRRALELARGAVGLASPNPLVGCVLVRDGAVIGEGAHRYDALDHAEIVALKQAGEGQARGATAYVTLEPCSHHGRTGPCADALIAAGVRRVVVATEDPNPLVRGAGIARLRSAGVEVNVGLLERAGREVNDGFAKFIRTRRPLVTLKAAVSADGMLAPAAGARVAGETFWITGAEARTEVQRMRHEADAVLTGIGTVLADDPLLTDRSGRVRRRRLLRVVLDSELRIPLDSQLVRTAAEDLLVVCGEAAASGRSAALQAAGVQIGRTGGREGRLDLPAVMEMLGERKILRVLLECGSKLNGAFLEEELVDEVVLFRSLTAVGSDGVPFAGNGQTVGEVERSLKAVSQTAFGQDLRVSGSLRDAWSGV